MGKPTISTTQSKSSVSSQISKLKKSNNNNKVKSSIITKSKSKSNHNLNSKPISNKKIKSQSKSTKYKIDKLNSNLSEFEEVRSSLFNHDINNNKNDNENDKLSALNYKQLKKDFKQDEQLKSTNKIIENDISKQLELITGIEL